MKKFLPFNKKKKPHSLLSKQCFQLLFLNPASRQFLGKKIRSFSSAAFSPCLQCSVPEHVFPVFSKSSLFLSGAGCRLQFGIEQLCAFFGCRGGRSLSCSCLCVFCVCVPKGSSTQLAETECLVLLGSGCLQNEHFQCSFPALVLCRWNFSKGRSMVLCKTEIMLFIWVES